jgi:hypothetical protein
MLVVTVCVKSEQRPNQQFKRYGAFAGFHICDMGLAQFELPCQVHLRHPKPQPFRAKIFCKSELDIDVCFFLGGKPEKLLGASNLPLL